MLLFDLRSKTIIELDRHAAREAIWSHKVAVVDPVLGEEAIALWSCMRLDPTSRPTAYVGPWLFFDPGAFTAPVLPLGGLPAPEALAAYMAGAPVELAQISATSQARLSVRRYRQPPANPWRRSVGAPLLNYPRHPEHFEKWQRFELQIRSIPAPKHLANWCQALRTQWWHRFAVHRFINDLASGRIVAYDSQTRDIPTSYWISDLDFDPVGDLYLRSDRRTPLYRRLEFRAAGDVPALAAARAAMELGGIKEAVLSAIQENVAELADLSLADRTELLASVLPFIPRPTLRSYCARNLPRR